MNEQAKQIIKHHLLNNSFTQTLYGNFKTKVADTLVQYAIDKTSSFIARETTVSLKLVKSGGINHTNYYNFLIWLSNNTKESSNKSIVPDEYETTTMDLGDKPVYFRYMGKHFICYKSAPAGKHEFITITMLGRNVNIMKSLFDQFKHKLNDQEVHLYTSDYGGRWNFISSVPKRKLDTVVIKKDVKESIIKSINSWRESKDWYVDRGLSYKLSLMLYGPPGTGKTSFIKAIASEYGFNVYIMNLNHYTDSTLQSALSNVSPNSILVMEDMDSFSVTQARSDKLKTVDVHEDEQDNIVDDPNVLSYGKDSGSLTLQGFLNAIDGLVPINDVIIIMTSNTITNIDRAITRKGRVDKSCYIGFLSDDEIKEYIKVRFPDDIIPDNIVYKDIAGCELQDLYLENKFDFDDFVKSIPMVTQE